MVESRLDVIAAGVISHKNAVMRLDINGKRVQVKNITDLTVDFNVTTQDNVNLGDTLAQHYGAYGSLEGSMTIHENHGVWPELITFFKNYGAFPDIAFTVSLPPGSVLVPRTSPNRQSRASVVPDASLDFTLYGVVFTKLPLIGATGTDFANGVEVTFVANDIEITNMLPGHDILSVVAPLSNE